jgi:hypothetical protein
MRIWGRRPPWWHFVVAFVLVFAIGLGLDAVFSTQVVGLVLLALILLGGPFWVGFSKGRARN